MINIKSDSRKVKPGDIFVALPGISSDGEAYVESAIANGASKIIVESDNKYSVETMKVESTRDYLNKYLSDNYGNIIDSMNIIGLTGTNGKTTTCYLIYQALNLLNIKCGYIGTIGYYLDKKVCNLPNTSPDICEIYDMLVNAYELGYKNVVMEASSQGLAMGRLDTIKFDIALFTNLTQDHLDYHKTMENYAKAKTLLFEKLKDNGISILNKDDSYYKNYEYKNVVYYGKNGDDYKLESYNLGYGTTFTLNIKGKSYLFESKLIGMYNIYNLISCISVLGEMNIEINSIIEVVKQLLPPPGRMDIIKYDSNLIGIDYAHTPDAMINIYDTINEIKKGKVITVFGCTGDRDRTKRPIMMDIALKNSDYVIVTSDDLHTEDFNQIINDMTQNVSYNHFEIIKRRGLAIEKGISLLKNLDILLILGKGHEEYIIVKEGKIPFNDKKKTEEILRQKINN